MVGRCPIVAWLWLLSLILGSRVCAATLDDATALFRCGQYEQCAEMAQRAIAERSYSENWRVLKLRAEIAVGRYAEALQTLDAALIDFPTSVRLRWLGHSICRYNGQAERADKLLDEIGELVSRASWRYRDSESRVTLGRYYLYRGFDARKVLEATFNVVKSENVRHAEALLAAGELALEKHDYELAAEELEKAAAADAKDPDVLCALAKAYAPSDEERARAYLEQALECNPNHVDSLLMLVDRMIDGEQYAEASDVLLRILAVNPLESRAWAYRAVLAHLTERPVDEQVCLATAASWWNANPEVDHLLGVKLSQKYRFAEGSACQRRALALNPDYLPAKIALSQDLLRLGNDDEGWRLADEVYQRDGYNVLAHNLVTLRDELSKYRLLEADGLVVRMEAREADLYGQRVVSLLRRAREQLCAKYEVPLDGAVYVEIFPRQQDFAVRTFGMPGGDGFLGVCFGNVVTANSPASQGEHPANWESVLWHEFCHAVTLHKTRNKMPRWLSEGISVYEERQADPRWGQRLTPRYREMILNGDLTPVSDLSGAFLDPESPLHLDFAYFEASLVVEFLVERHGLAALKQILQDLGQGVPVPQAFLRGAAPLERLDQEFAEFARQRAQSLGRGVDWGRPELAPDADAEAWAAWNREHRDNYWGLRGQAECLIAAGRWEDARRPLERLVAIYPEDAGRDSAHARLAEVHKQLNAADAERAALEQLAGRSDDAVAAYLRLLELHAAADDWEGVRRNVERLLAVNPLLAAPHRWLARAAEKANDDRQVVESLRAVLQFEPLDLADVHFRLAESLLRLDDRAAARRHVLMALEEAPRFQAAQMLLLEIVGTASETAVRRANYEIGGSPASTTRPND